MSILLLELLLNLKDGFLDQNHDTIYTIFTQMWAGGWPPAGRIVMTP
jgi:hypothetical protein